jgi:hypothetical protein
MELSKEILMAYADGELDADAHAAVEAALAAEPELAREVERHRAIRRQLQSAFKGVLEEPVPERLISAARTAPTASARETKVVDLSQTRSRSRAPRSWALPQWAAMAACLIVGLFLGYQVLRPTGDGAFVTDDGRLIARGSLAVALSNQLAGESSKDNPVRVTLSFRDRSGHYCRAFSMRDEGALAGVACHEGEDWRVQALAQSRPASAEGQYRMAAGDLPASVLQAVQERIEGEPLDAAGEETARQNHWR